MSHRTPPRHPTSQELEQLAQYLTTQADYSFTLTEAREYVPTLYVAVFDDYITTSPGYTGKVMIVVSDDSPGLHDVYIWHKEQLEKVMPDTKPGL